MEGRTIPGLRVVNIVRSVFLIFGTLVLVSCAVQRPPEGGPPDTDPPVIISTYPTDYATHYHDNRIALEFDEYVNQRTVEESIFISPYLGELEFDWSGKEVEITFTGQLRKNTTYVVNVGTDVADLQGNKMARASTFAFSTGDDIDHGAIEGRVFPEKAGDETRGIMIFAYLLSGVDPDTLDPRTLKPDYITQTGKDGSFFLHHLAFGPYRVFAVKDEYRNLLYDPEADEYGVPAYDIVLTPDDTLQSGVFMRLAKEDTTAPRLVKTEAKDAYHILADFSEDLDTASTSPLQVSVIDTLSGDSLRITAVYANIPKLSSFFVLTDKQDSTKKYRLSVIAARDQAGNSINLKANSLLFGGSSKPTAGGVRLTSVSIHDSSLSVELTPEFIMLFSDALSRDTLAVVMKDHLGRVVPTTLSFLTDAALSIRPKSRLQSKTWYRVHVKLREIKDWRGRPSKDSTKTFRFETLDEEMMSSIEGIVVRTSHRETTGSVYVNATSVSEKEPRSYTLRANPSGGFTSTGIVEGRYILQAFLDRNGNGKYDPGRPFPFSHSEPLSSYSDTLKVRARWPLEGARIELK